MRFLHPDRDELLELSLDDCFIVPGYFDGRSRQEVDLRPDDFACASHPLVSANMNAVTGKRMAETVATGQPADPIRPFALDRFETFHQLGERGAASVGS